METDSRILLARETLAVGRPPGDCAAFDRYVLALEEIVADYGLNTPALDALRKRAAEGKTR